MNRRGLSGWMKTSTSDEYLKQVLSEIGIQVDLDTGHLSYLPDFKPLSINFDLVFVRHGETYGNCGQSIDGKIDVEAVKKAHKDRDKRIYQGDVDDEINQLTEEGKEQAIKLVKRLDAEFLAKGWKPDLILISPLKRAYDTALPFIDHIKRNQIEASIIIDKRIKEISFGAWENQRICDFHPLDCCHDFYRKQHALVKSRAPESENFCGLLLRAYQTMLDFNERYADKQVLMVSHSMFGAALHILFNLGTKVENDDYLAFDGVRKDGTSYTIPHASPLVLHLRRPKESAEWTV